MSDIFTDFIDWLKNIFSDDKRPEIQRGIQAIHHVLKTRRDIPHAMCRADIGIIGFRYGWHKPATKTRKRSGHGIAHIIGSALEDYGKYKGSPEPEEVLRMIPEAIMDGTIMRSHKGRLRLDHKGHIVLLSAAGKHKKAPHWLFHAYKRYK